tara:strand:+ start:36668 stop:36958 length:291 start_codon:yes stop_codon:yes gene_type:complete
LTPIKAVNHNQLIEKLIARYNDSKIITPAINRNDSFIVIFILHIKVEPIILEKTKLTITTLKYIILAFAYLIFTNIQYYANMSNITLLVEIYAEVK